MPELEQPKDFVIELNNWKMRDFRAFIAAVRDDKWEDVFPLLSRVIVSWPYGEVSSAALEELGLEHLATTIRAVNIAVGNAFSQGN